jgi:UDP-glucose 4-epimerase
MAVLVTGGAGYVGSHAVATLVNDNRSVVVLDNETSGQWAGIQSQFPNVVCIKASLSQTALIAQILQQYQVSAVFHFAASCIVAESFEQPVRYFQNNVYGTQSLLQAMAMTDVKQLVVSSSCAVYGHPQTLPLSEDHPLNPISPYGWTKHLMEVSIQDACKRHHLNCIILRYFNAAGAHPQLPLGENHHPETHLIPLMLQVASGRRTEPLCITGDDYDTPDGSCIRDYVHVCDLIQAHRLALTHLETRSDSSSVTDSHGACAIYNLGADKGYSIKQVLALAKTVTGGDIPIIMGSRRPGDPAILVANSNKIRQTLGWMPCYSDMETILKTAWQWEQRLSVGLC